MSTSTDKRTALERTQELFEFLQGHVPEGYQIKKRHIPKLTADQAYTVVWYLGNQYWEVTDHVYRCDVCGDLYDGNDSGDVLDYGKGPVFFCDGCVNGPEYAAKVRPEDE